jgi:uncharacterized protein YdhG (YjbR/CyaY superfamily)
LSSIDEYIATLSGAERDVVVHMYEVIRAALPVLEPGLSYGMPALMYRGKGFISVMATKKFLSLYPFSGSVINQLSDELAEFECTKGSIHFVPERPLSDALIRKIVTVRLQVAEERAAR